MPDPGGATASRARSTRPATLAELRVVVDPYTGLGGKITEEVIIAESVKSADRVLDALDLLARHPEGMTFTDVCDALSWPKSSAHGLLGTLTARGFLEVDAQRRYSIGLRTWEVGRAYLRGEDLAADALPQMRLLGAGLKETVQLAVLDGRENVYIAKVDAPQSLALASRVGIRLPAHVTGVGKVLLAGLPDSEVAKRLAGVTLTPFTPATITSVPDLLENLKDVRERGYAVDEGEYTAGVYCIAVPVRDAEGSVAAAMSVSVPDVRVTPELVERMRKGLLEASSKLSSRLGYREPASAV